MTLLNRIQNNMLALASRLMVVASLSSAAAMSMATPVIDQSAPDTDSPALVSFFQKGLAQSFKQSATNISGAGVFFSSYSPVSGEASISLFDALPNAGGNLLASGSGIATGGSWFDVFWSPVHIAVDQTYFLVMEGYSYLVLTGSLQNSYPDGGMYVYDFYPQLNNDLTFRTYADIQAGPNAVPEPSSFALLGFGLAALTMIRRRRT